MRVVVRGDEGNVDPWRGCGFLICVEELREKVANMYRDLMRTAKVKDKQEHTQLKEESLNCCIVGRSCLVCQTYSGSHELHTSNRAS